MGESSSSSSSSSKNAIVFGSTGAVGRHLVELISKEQPTWTITAVTRSPSTDKFKNLANVKVVKGDPNVHDQVMDLCADQDIIYSCVGFAHYETKYWAKHWPVVVGNLLAASIQGPRQQKLVFCDNLYAYGAATNISPKSSVVPPSTKSKLGIRSMLRQKFQQRMKERPDSITVVGGSDFYGEYVTHASFLGNTFTKAIIEGKTAPIAIGSASVVHDFCYAPDFSRALYIASINDKANGKFWICPHSIHNKTMDQIAQDVSRLSNSKTSKVTVYKAWTVRLLSPFMGFMKEMIEMLPNWTNDYTVDDSHFCKAFGVQATPYEESLAAYIEFYNSL